MEMKSSCSVSGDGCTSIPEEMMSGEDEALAVSWKACSLWRALGADLPGLHWIGSNGRGD